MKVDVMFRGCLLESETIRPLKDDWVPEAASLDKLI